MALSADKEARDLATGYAICCQHPQDLLSDFARILRAIARDVDSVARPRVIGMCMGMRSSMVHCIAPTKVSCCQWHLKMTAGHLQCCAAHQSSDAAARKRLCTVSVSIALQSRPSTCRGCCIGSPAGRNLCFPRPSRIVATRDAPGRPPRLSAARRVARVLPGGVSAAGHRRCICSTRISAAFVG